jgi:hypothetical protein
MMKNKNVQDVANLIDGTKSTTRGVKNDKPTTIKVKNDISKNGEKSAVKMEKPLKVDAYVLSSLYANFT